MRITWINFLHFYQPPTADNEIVIEAAEKSYKRIISALKRNPKIEFTVNISGCLLDRLFRLGYKNLIDDMAKLHRSGRLELVGSAAFHPILPLLPKQEAARNIEINEQILKKYFGEKCELTGFFPPEAAINSATAKIIKAKGYRWLLADQISRGEKGGTIDYARRYVDKKSGLEICFRDRAMSQSYVPKQIFNLINQGKSAIIVTATDAELYGLRHSDFRANFEKLLKRPEVATATISRYLSGLKINKKISLAAGSWESSEKELAQGEPFKLWQNKSNKIQSLLWRLAELAITTVNGHQKDENYHWSRQHLDKGLASCTFWWASARDFKLFGGTSWNPDEIEKGLNELIRSIRALADPKTKQAKIQAEKIYINIKKLIWLKHWNYYWGK